MALGKNRTRINVKGGGTLKIRELSPTPVDAWSDLGIVESITLNDENSMIDIPDAEGNMLGFLSGQRRTGLEINLAQTSKEEIDVVKDADGKYYDVYYSVYLVGTQQYQEYSWPLVAIKPGPMLNFAGSTKRTLKIEAVALAPKGAFTETPADFNVVENETYSMYESGSAVGPPAGTAATKATAII